MGLFDDFGKRVKDAGQKSVQKTRELSEISHINTLISQAESNINRTYYEIGKAYVNLHRDDSEESLASMVSSITNLEAEIEQYKKQIQQIRGVQVCSQCGAEISRGSAYCSSCGAQAPKMEKPRSNEDLVECSSCGAMVKKGMRFCTSCGSPMTVPDTIPSSSEATSPITDQESNPGETAFSICPKCGNQLTPDSIFCPECGYKL